MFIAIYSIRENIMGPGPQALVWQIYPLRNIHLYIGNNCIYTDH
jgi:hypothetical protein